MTKALRNFERSLPMTLLQTREAVMKTIYPITQRAWFNTTAVACNSSFGA